MINFAPTAVEGLVTSLTVVTDQLPGLGNSFLCVDSSCTVGRACINFCACPKPVSKVFFGASAICGTAGAIASGAALVTSFAGIPVAGYLGTFGARSLNRLGKYTLQMGTFQM
jgi:hypothetical protein